MKKQSLFILLLSALLIGTALYANDNGTLIGVLRDSNSKEPLPGANIVIEETALGSSSDLDGTFYIASVPVGEHTISFSYVGYRDTSVVVTITAGQTTRLDMLLRLDVVETEAVTVTALLEGQAHAINQQLSSNTIVNIVSSDKIKELPDQNAAESIARLPGVSMVRDAGEGQKVVVRGLSPKYNSITINGERIPATGGIVLISDEELTRGGEDRSVDLSMISPDVLEGIEIYKALTPDKDADAIGGTVNLSVRKAREGLRGDLRLQYGYNDQVGEFGQFKGSFNVSNRYINNKLGLFATGSIQRADRGSDLLDASYGAGGFSAAGNLNIIINDLNLGSRVETRDRYSASLALDYDLTMGSILWSNFWSRTDRNEVRLRRRYRVDVFRQEYDLRDLEVNAQAFSSVMSGQHQLGVLEFGWRGSYSRTNQKTPFSHTARFRELAAFNTPLVDDQGPSLIPAQAKNRLENTFFKESRLDNSEADERDITAQLDLKLPFTLGKNLAGYLKSGGKYRDKRRTRDNTRFWTEAFGINDIGDDIANNRLESYRPFELDGQNRILIGNFIDPSFDANDFLNGQYDLGLGLDSGELNRFLNFFRNQYVADPRIDLEDYETGERIAAGYLMAEINFGRKVMLLPGFRYEKTFNDYQTIFGDPLTDDQLEEEDPAKTVFQDTTGTRDYGEFLPMIHLRYKFTGWGDIRLAATKTLSRPDYFTLVPWQRIDFFDSTVERGNPNLKHTTAWNYDAYLSFYNYLGLLTVGVFYKELDNVDYIRTSRIVDPSSRTNGFSLTAPENAGSTSTIKGFEVELQTNLRFLPQPFDGIVLGGNFSRIDSETEFPLLLVGTNPDPPFNAIFKDSVRTGKMPNQTDYIANLTIGYEKGGFTGRLSMIYQGDSSQEIGPLAELDDFNDNWTRWDLTLQQKIWRGASLYVNANNITDLSEREFFGSRDFPTVEEFFGWTVDLGIRYRF